MDLPPLQPPRSLQLQQPHPSRLTFDRIHVHPDMAPAEWILDGSQREKRRREIDNLIMAANAAGIIGSQYFQAADAPLYPIGWILIVSLVSVSFFCIIWANLQYLVLNRRLAKQGSTFRWRQKIRPES